MSLDNFPDIHALTIYQQGLYPPVASACIFLYDYLITIDDEVHYIWGTPGSAGKILFLLTRYLTFGDVVLAIYRNTGYSLTEEACRTLYGVSGWFAIIGITVAELILVIRVWAIWNQSRPIGISILVVLAALVIATIVAFVRTNKSTTGFVQLSLVSSSLVGCLPSQAPDMMIVAYLSVMIFELLMAALLLLRGLKDLPHRSSSFLYRIYRDGFAYYALLSVVSILNVVFVASGSRELANLLMAPQRILHSILSARMILRLREDSFRRQLCDTITQPLGESIFMPTIYTPTLSHGRWPDDGTEEVLDDMCECIRGGYGECSRRCRSRSDRTV